MPTNAHTVASLRKMARLIDDKLQNVVDEIKGYNRLLKQHVGQQARQINPSRGARHKYNKRKKKIELSRA